MDENRHRTNADGDRMSDTTDDSMPSLQSYHESTDSELRLSHNSDEASIGAEDPRSTSSEPRVLTRSPNILLVRKWLEGLESVAAMDRIPNVDAGTNQDVRAETPDTGNIDVAGETSMDPLSLEVISAPEWGRFQLIGSIVHPALGRAVVDPAVDYASHPTSFSTIGPRDFTARLSYAHLNQVSLLNEVATRDSESSPVPFIRAATPEGPSWYST